MFDKIKLIGNAQLCMVSNLMACIHLLLFGKIAEMYFAF